MVEKVNYLYVKTYIWHFLLDSITKYMQAKGELALGEKVKLVCDINCHNITDCIICHGSKQQLSNCVAAIR